MTSVRANVLWDYAGSLSGQVISFVISLVLARMIGPEEFGVVALAMVIISMATIFATMGFGASIINSRELDPRAVNTIFILNIVIGLLLTLMGILFAPLISRFYGSEQLESVLRVLSVIFVFSTAQSVQHSLLNREMKFRQLAKLQVITGTFSGIVGIAMAYQGMGVWALVGQALISSVATTLFYWYLSPWRPGLSFSVESIRPHWKYSSKLFMASILDNLYQRFDVILFGRIFSLSVVGNFNRARSFNRLIVRNSSQSIMKVLFPYISKWQGNLEELRRVAKKGLHVISFLSFGLIAVFASCGNDLIIFLYSAKWADTVPIFYWLVLGGFAYPLSALLVNVIRGNGNSKLFLQIEIAKKVITASAFVIAWKFGLMAFLKALLVTQILNVLINMYAVRLEIRLELITQLAIMAKYAFGAFIILGSIRYLNDFTDTGYLWLNVLHQAGAAGSLFILYNFIFKSTGLQYIVDMGKPLLNRLNKKPA